MNEVPLRQVTEDEIRAYEEDGIVCLREMFDADWVERLRAAAEDCMGKPGPMVQELATAQKDKGRFFADIYVWTYNDDCRAYVFQSPAAKIAAAMMRSQQICIFFDQWLVKEPGTPTRTPWHHDLPYWPVNGNQICTVWLALDPVTAENGSVEYIKGSHRWEQRYRAQSFTGDTRYKEELPPVPDIDARRDEFSFAQFDMQPGDCTVHHGLTVHGAPGNATSAARRRALVSRWAGDDATYYPRPNIMPQLREPGLAPGAPIECDLWPRVWPPHAEAAE